MSDWKEEIIGDYLAIEREKKLMQEEMAKDPAISKFKSGIEDIERQLQVHERIYTEKIHNYETQMQYLKEELVERWDSDDKSFKCEAGSVTMKTTQSLNIKDKKGLISKLQQLDKLTECIKGWDIRYLRKLVNVGLFDDSIVSYDEKRNVVIAGTKSGEATKEVNRL
jgi:ASC-1-like (ASCH) protein